LQKKDDRTVDSTATGPDDPKFSGSGADPNFMRYDQPGANNGPGPGYTPSQHPYPNEANHPGTGIPDSHAKPSKFGGKIQTAIGTMVGSESLRAKGMEKERFVFFASLDLARTQQYITHTNREARTLNMQSSELAQAESLEREAQMHRDRAMGGGGYF